MSGRTERTGQGEHAARSARGERDPRDEQPQQPQQPEQPQRSALQHYTENVSPFVERFAADLTDAGLQRMAARVFACLIASEDGALSSAELAERLQVSPAAISGAVRYLAQVHMVNREREPGSRREVYRVHADTWYEAITNREALLNRWQGTLLTGAESLGTDTPAGRRLLETSDFFDFLKSEMTGLMRRWREQLETRDRR